MGAGGHNVVKLFFLLQVLGSAMTLNMALLVSLVLGDYSRSSDGRLIWTPALLEGPGATYITFKM